MSTNYVIYIYTNDGKYEENWYGLNETIDRADVLRDCNNVNLIDIVDGCTGEVMATIKYGKVEYVTIDVAIRMCHELFGA